MEINYHENMLGCSNDRPEQEQAQEKKEPRQYEVFNKAPSPENLKSEVATYVFKSWGGLTAKSITGMLEDLATERHVLAADHPRGIEADNLGAAPDEFGKNFGHKIPESELMRIADAHKVMVENGIDMADLVGDSQGGWEAVLYAAMYPERVRNLVLIEPAGLIGEDSQGQLIARNVVSMIKGLVRTQKERFLPPGAEGTLERQEAENRQIGMAIGAEDMKETFSKYTKEALLDDSKAISGADIVEILAHLRSLGIKISIIQGVDDEIFPIEKTINNLREKGALRGGPKDILNGFYSIKGDHGYAAISRGRFTELVKNALTSLENLEDSEENSPDRAPRLPQFEALKNIFTKLRLAEAEQEKGLAENLEAARKLSQEIEEMLNAGGIGKDIVLYEQNIDDARVRKADLNRGIVRGERALGLYSKLTDNRGSEGAKA